jgi:hypothetical protein
MNERKYARNFGGSLLSLAGVLLSANSPLAAERYVNVNSANPTPPYTNWSTAATNIQAAVDVAAAGDEILVTNGIYSTGDRWWSATFNRVVVDKSLRLRSVNGPSVTIIDGGQSDRCVYLTNGASLCGFTLTNGSAQWGGGVFCESTNAAISQCVVSGNSAFYDWATPPAQGGGVFGGTLSNCTLSGNTAKADLRFSTPGVGGGACLSTLNNCTLMDNSAEDTTAADGWPSPAYGGGAADCLLNNCALIGNTAGVGGGASGSTLNNCTVTGNSGSINWASLFQPPGVGGAYGSALNNCIVYFNTGYFDNCDPSSALNYCCTFPLPTNGVCNIDGVPLLMRSNGWVNLRLQPASPCINAGNNAYAVGATDLDGNPRVNRGRVDIGAYEFQANSRYVDINSFNPSPPYTNWATAATNIQHAVDAAVAGDEIVVTNGIYANGQRWATKVVVDKALSLRSVNGPTVTAIDGGGSNRCVYLTNGATLSGFTLTNGVGQFGHGSSWGPGPLIGGGLWCESLSAVVSNCVISGNSTASDYDYELFIGEGGGVYGGTLNNCTLSENQAVGLDFNGSAPGYGGGAAQATLNNCTVIGNFALYGSGFDAGGGVSDCTLNNCILSGNSAYLGGGAYNSTLNNCTLCGNSTMESFGFLTPGGGAFGSTLNNCVIYFNNGTNYDPSSVLNYCCTTPLPTGGIGNIDFDPLFVNTNGWTDLRLQSNSPCINAGLNAVVSAGPDLDGNSRLAGGAVDIGAYEFQSPTSTISYAWLQQYGLATDGSADFADPDGDGMNNWQEWRCGTDPTNALSALRLLGQSEGGTNVMVTWQSVAGVSYFLQRRINLGVSSAFTMLATGIPGQPVTTTFIDTNAPGAGSWFYRVGVGN